MAQASSSRQTPADYPDEPSFDDRPAGEERETSRRRLSTSTTASRRHSHYDSQRTTVGRRSRPVSWASAQTSATQQPRSKRASYAGSSYADPKDWSYLGEEAMPMPARPDANKVKLEDVRGGEKRPGSAPARNFSLRDAVRKRASAGKVQDEQQNLAEASGVPPAQEDRGDGYAAVPGAAETSDESSGPFRPRHPDDALPEGRPKEVPRLLTELYTISYLTFFSIWGTLARLGVQWITFYPGTPLVTPVTWANAAGSFILGFLAEDQGLFRDDARIDSLIEKHQDMDELEQIIKEDSMKRKKTIPLYIGLAVGFCGSFTSFSSFTRDVFLAVSNNMPTPYNHSYPPTTGTYSTSAASSRNGGYSFEALVAVILYTLALSLGGLMVGAHCATFLSDHTPKVPMQLIRKFLDPAIVILGWGCWLGSVFMAIWPPDRPSGPDSRGSWSREAWRGEVIFALVFAPLGCLLRFYASLKLNGLVAAFPLGTFAVNMFGTAVEGMCFDIQHVGVGVDGLLGGGRVGCQVLQGVMDGFCGCLTTVSTWVAEINGLKRKHGYAYGLSSVVCGLCLMVVIMGSVRWTVGWSDPACPTGYPSKIYS